MEKLDLSTSSKSISAQTRSHDWVREVFDTYYETVFSYVCALTRNRTDALDVVQNLFVRIMKNPQPFQAADTLKTYILAASRKEAFRYFEHRSKLAGNEKSMAHDGDILVAAPSAAPALDKKELTTINRSMASLPEDQLEAVILRIYKELTFSEMSNVIGIPQDTCRSRYKAGIQKLAEKLKHV